MRKTLLLALVTLSIFACGGDNQEEMTDEQYLTQLQNEAFARVQDNIVGEWHTAKFYNNGTYSDYWGQPTGWLDIDISKNNVAYSFKSDGTFTEAGGEISGTYKIYKNTSYPQYPNVTVPTCIEFDYHKTGISPTKRGITIDNNGYMRIYTFTGLYGTEYVSFDDYPANYQYSKR